jgi:hypothetical protein
VYTPVCTYEIRISPQNAFVNWWDMRFPACFRAATHVCERFPAIPKSRQFAFPSLAGAMLGHDSATACRIHFAAGSGGRPGHGARFRRKKTFFYDFPRHGTANFSDVWLLFLTFSYFFLSHLSPFGHFDPLEPFRSRVRFILPRLNETKLKFCL